MDAVVVVAHHVFPLDVVIIRTGDVDAVLVALVIALGELVERRGGPEGHAVQRVAGAVVVGERVRGGSHK